MRLSQHVWELSERVESLICKFFLLRVIFSGATYNGYFGRAYQLSTYLGPFTMGWEYLPLFKVTYYSIWTLFQVYRSTRTPLTRLLGLQVWQRLLAATIHNYGTQIYFDRAWNNLLTILGSL
jgi:hypothetical protein